MPRVYSRRRGAETPPAGSVYVGRGTPYGNPYVIGKDGTREQVIAEYRDAVSPAFAEMVRKNLRGKHLVCWCAPCGNHELQPKPVDDGQLVALCPNITRGWVLPCDAAGVRKHESIVRVRPAWTPPESPYMLVLGTKLIP